MVHRSVRLEPTEALPTAVCPVKRPFDCPWRLRPRISLDPQCPLHSVYSKSTQGLYDLASIAWLTGAERAGRRCEGSPKTGPQPPAFNVQPLAECYGITTTAAREQASGQGRSLNQKVYSANTLVLALSISSCVTLDKSSACFLQ